jgi:hypothetical protein
MAASIARALARIKDDLRAFVTDASIERAARDAGHRWRERQLGPVETVHLFVLQVIHFNTAMRTCAIWRDARSTPLRTARRGCVCRWTCCGRCCGRGGMGGLGGAGGPGLT